MEIWSHKIYSVTHLLNCTLLLLFFPYLYFSFLYSVVTGFQISSSSSSNYFYFFFFWWEEGRGSPREPCPWLKFLHAAIFHIVVMETNIASFQSKIVCYMHLGCCLPAPGRAHSRVNVAQASAPETPLFPRVAFRCSASAPCWGQGGCRLSIPPAFKMQDKCFDKGGPGESSRCHQQVVMGH